MNKINNYINNVILEMKKVSWLNKDELLGSTLVVGLFSIIIGIVLFVMDLGISQIVVRVFGG